MKLMFMVSSDVDVHEHAFESWRASDTSKKQRWLFTTKSMTAHQKQKLWHQCVFACVRYGLVAVGFTKQTFLLFHRFCMKQL